MAASLTNAFIDQHPYLPDRDAKTQIRPKTCQVIDVEIPHRVFLPAAKAFGQFTQSGDVNLARRYADLIENMAALAQVALSLSRRPAPHAQIGDVRLLYYSILDPETFVQMREDGQTPATKPLKAYHSHLLRLVTTVPRRCGDSEEIPPDEPMRHTFANMQKYINTQRERLAAEAEKGKRRPKKSKKDEDEDEESETERKLREEAIELERKRDLSYGLSNPSTLPRFVNPQQRFFAREALLGLAQTGGKLQWLPYADASKWRQLVDAVLARDSATVPSVGDINDPENPYNPAVVFSPQLAFLHRRHYMTRRPEAALLYEQHKARHDLRGEDVYQDEINQRKWYGWKRGSRGKNMTVGGEFNLGGVEYYATPYDGETCWLLDIEHFRPETWRDTLFPWATEHVSADNHDETREYVLRAPLRGTMDTSLLTGVERRMVETMYHDTAAEVETQFRHQVNMRPMIASGFTKQQWIADCRRNREAAVARVDKEFAGRDMSRSDVQQARLERQREEVLKAKVNNVQQFIKHIFSAEPTNSLTGRAIAKWFKTKEREARVAGKPLTFSHPREYKNHNLSSFGDLMRKEAEELTHLCFVESGHESLVRFLLAALQVHIRECMPTHTLSHSRDGGINKSFLLKLLCKHLIEGTTKWATKITAAAFSASDVPPDENGRINTFDGHILIIDELLPSMVDSNATAGGAGSSGQSNDLPSIIKSIMTSCMYGIAACAISSGRDGAASTHRRQSEQIIADCRSSFLMNTNKGPEEFTPPFLDRSLVTQSVYVDKLVNMQTGGVPQMMNHEAAQTEENRQRTHARYDRWHRNQCFSYIIGALLESGDLLDGFIDSQCAYAVYKWVTEDQDRFDLSNFERPRTFDQYKAMCQGAVLLDLMDKMFDIPGAPMHNRDWDWRYLFQFFEKHLVVLQEHAVFALGMIRVKFENVEYMQSRDLLYKWLRVQWRDSDRRDERRLLDDAAKARQSITMWTSAPKRPPPRDVVQFVITTTQTDGSSSPSSGLYEWTVKNPSIFTESSASPSSSAVTANRDSSKQLQQLANALIRFNERDGGIYRGLKFGAVLGALKRMQDTQVAAPLWYENSCRGAGQPQYLPSTTETQRTRQLVLQHDWSAETGRVSVLRVPVVMGTGEIDVERPQTTATCLHDAVEYVLQSEHSARRDLVYGARDVRIPDVWQTISLRSSQELQREHLRTMKQTHNVVTYDEDGNPTIEGDDILEPLDTYFLRRFYLKHGVPKVLRWLYPPGDPVHLMRVLFLLYWPYEMSVPYPMHHPNYFEGESDRRRDEARQRNAKKRHLVLQEAEQKSLAERDAELDVLMLERAMAVSRKKRRMARKPRLARDGRGKELYKHYVRKWELATKKENRPGLGPYLAQWGSGVNDPPSLPEGEEGRVSSGLESVPLDVLDPLTRCEFVLDETSRADRSEMLGYHNDTMVTLQDCEVDKIRRRVRVQRSAGDSHALWWMIENGHFQPCPATVVNGVFIEEVSGIVEGDDDVQDMDLVLQLRQQGATDKALSSAVPAQL